MVEATQKTTLLNNRPLSEYTVVLTDEKDRCVAEQLMQRLGDTTQIRLLDETVGGSVIRIGATYRNGRGSNDLDGFIINSYTDADGNVFCIDASSPKAYSEALDEFLLRTKITENEDTRSVLIPYESVYSVEIEKKKIAEHEYVHWTFLGESRRKLSDGVIYAEALYLDQDNLPNRTYTLLVDPQKNNIDMGSGDDGFAFRLDAQELRQTTEQHMRAAVKNGKNVIAGISGDFFDIDDGYLLDDYHPFGLTVKEGRIISLGDFDCRPVIGKNRESNSRGFFGVNKKGEPLIALDTDYREEMDLETAVGGAYILAKSAKTNFIRHQHDIIHGGVHPRSLAGFDENGNIVLMVIDGRQPIHSMGASLLQCALLMQRYGASDSLLLDGGGTSCMVLRNPKTDEYIVPDKPSDFWLRHIYNSILVIAKEQ